MPHERGENIHWHWKYHIQVFNRRLRCNTKCPRLEGSEKEECEIEYCEGFKPFLTPSQREEQEQQAILDYLENEYNYDYDNEDTENWCYPNCESPFAFDLL